MAEDRVASVGSLGHDSEPDRERCRTKEPPDPQSEPEKDIENRPPSRRISAEFAEKTSLAENPPEKNAASRKSAE